MGSEGAIVHAHPRKIRGTGKYQEYREIMEENKDAGAATQAGPVDVWSVHDLGAKRQSFDFLAGEEIPYMAL